MDPLPNISRAPFGLGSASFVLGAIGLLLCPLPILGAPISSIGLIGGLVGCGLVLAASTGNFRWAAAGVALSALALCVNLAIAYVPSAETALAGGSPNPTRHPKAHLCSPAPPLALCSRRRFRSGRFPDGIGKRKTSETLAGIGRQVEYKRLKWRRTLPLSSIDGKPLS